MDNIERPEDYDSAPVKYCARCYSLKIKYEEALDSECCAECGSTDIQEALIGEWEKKYEGRYGHRLVQKTEDPKKTYFFKMTPKELMHKVADSPKWKEIIRGIYSHFPEGYSKADSVVLFFDMLTRQNKLGELKLFLFKHFKY
jgi:hypothetical protein